MASCVLKGANHHFQVGKATTRKLPLTLDNLNTVFDALSPSPSHDDILFATQLFTGFENLLCLGKLCWPDKPALHDYCKVTMHHMVKIFDNYIGLFLPGHKGNAFFKGNCLIIQYTSQQAFDLFTHYLETCDSKI